MFSTPSGSRNLLSNAARSLDCDDSKEIEVEISSLMAEAGERIVAAYCVELFSPLSGQSEAVALEVYRAMERVRRLGRSELDRQKRTP
jgi:hypothetical protein